MPNRLQDSYWPHLLASSLGCCTRSLSLDVMLLSFWAVKALAFGFTWQGGGWGKHPSLDDEGRHSNSWSPWLHFCLWFCSMNNLVSCFYQFSDIVFWHCSQEFYWSEEALNSSSKPDGSVLNSSLPLHSTEHPSLCAGLGWHYAWCFKGYFTALGGKPMYFREEF